MITINKKDHCLILGSSPSCDDYDMEKLKSNFFCIGCNEWGGTEHEFDAYVLNHTNTLLKDKFNPLGSSNLIKLIKSNKLKLCTDTNLYKDLLGENSFCLNCNDYKKNEYAPLYDKSIWKPGYGTVIGSAISLSVFLNFKYTFLLGVDFKKNVSGYSKKHIMQYIDIISFNKQQKNACYYNDDIIKKYREPYYMKVSKKINIASISRRGKLANWDWFPTNNIAEEIIESNIFTCKD